MKAPDFLLERGDLRFYLEATTAHDFEVDEPRVRRWKTDVRVALDKIVSNDFFVTLDWEIAPTSQPSGTGLQHQVREWLLGLTYSAVCEAFYDDGEVVPELRVDVGGGRIRLTPIPKSKRRPTGSLVGIEGFGITNVHAIPAIRKSLRSKSGRYGEMDLPYIVAINVLSDVAEEDEYVDALLGMPEVIVFASGESQVRHGKDGAFGHAARPRAVRVSAVLCVRAMSPWSLGQQLRARVMRLVHHPWTLRPLPKNSIAVSEHISGDEFSAALDARQVLRITPDWPEALSSLEHASLAVRRVINRLIPLC